MPHSPDIIEAVMALAATGISRSQIAAQIGGISRSAVCALLWRKGVKAPPRPPKPKRIHTPRAYVRKAKPSQPEPGGVPVSGHSNSPGVTWADLGWLDCKWPLDNGLWCGRAQSGGSYCRHHAAMAYRPAADRQHRKAA